MVRDTMLLRLFAAAPSLTWKQMVLVDVAALGDANDAVLLGCGGDGVVLVLKANTSRRESARKAVQDLQTAKVRVLGAVLNQRTFPIPESIYRKL